MNALRRLVPGLVVLTAACASWRLSGYPAASARAPARAENPGRLQPPAAPAARADDAETLSVSTTPRADAPRAAVPPTPPERAREALFYSDMGPDTVDVSAYPAQQRYNYQVFARDCSECHTLARAINAPMVGRGWWDFYIIGMRARSRWQKRSLPKDEIKAVLDFLEYDSRVRKVDHAREFDELTETLKARFDAELTARVRALQKSNPKLLAPPPP